MPYTYKHGDRPLEGYTIQRAVGRGGFGEVYYAVSDGGREVGLKYLRDNPHVELRGVTHCMNLKNPHLVTIFDVKQNPEGEYFIVMEYVSGPSLRDLLIAEPKGLGVQKAAFFVRELAKGLGYLHDRGIVHRDMKPGNIFYEDGYVKIGDYGLSKFISVSRHSAQTSSVGTVHYMAPEIGGGSYSRGVDIYALGVILYEMLLGRVPFEGATLGEVLMKHLTQQPEVDELPHPFPEVIRRSLAKDPNDRYQTVHEMVEAIFGVEDIEKSLVGFNPASLSTIAHRAAGDIVDSPVPSPNSPYPGPPGARPARSPQPPYSPRSHDPGKRLPPASPKLAARMNRIRDKVDRKMARLAQRTGRAAPAAPSPSPSPEPRLGESDDAVPASERTQRIVLASMMAMGIATAIGLIIGNTCGEDEGVLAGVSSFMLTAAMAGSVVLSRWVMAWMTVARKATWAERMVHACCCLPLIAVGAAPMLDQMNDQGLWVAGGLAVACIFADWDSRLRSGARGELKFGPAISVAILALIATMVFSQGDAEEYGLMAAGVAAAASLSVQALGLAVPERLLRSKPPKLPPIRGGEAHGQVPPPPPPPFYADARRSPGHDWRHASPAGAAAAAVYAMHAAHGAQPSAGSGPRPRSVILRGFWSVVAFCFLCGLIVAFVAALTLDDEYFGNRDGRASTLASTIGCFAFMFFALSKTTVYKRRGFWRETIRPFLMAAATAVIGIGASILAMMNPRGEDKVGAISAIAVASVLLFILLVSCARGRCSRRGAPFTAGATARAAFIEPPSGDALAGAPNEARGDAAELL